MFTSKVLLALVTGLYLGAVSVSSSVNANPISTSQEFDGAFQDEDGTVGVESRNTQVMPPIYMNWIAPPISAE